MDPRQIPQNREGNAPLHIIYEDNHILCVEKPPGLLSQSDRSGDPDLLTLCKEYIKIKYNRPGNVYLALIHRLDRAVGGVMVFARTSKAAARLSEQFRDHQVSKFYHAVVEGVLTPGEGELVHYLRKDEKERVARPIGRGERGAQEARLLYRVLKVDREYKAGPLSYVEVELLTGRFHQIRFQMSRSGHPILGDVKYSARYPFPNRALALRAFRLELEHPVKKVPLILESQDPAGWPLNRGSNSKGSAEKPGKK